MPALTEDVRGTGAGVRKPAGEEPAGFGAVAVPRSLWVFGQLVWDERRRDRSGWACVWGARTSQLVAMVRFGVVASRAMAASAANDQRVSADGR
jgi:hypothetical protein